MLARNKDLQDFVKAEKKEAKKKKKKQQQNANINTNVESNNEIINNQSNFFTRARDNINQSIAQAITQGTFENDFRNTGSLSVNNSKSIAPIANKQEEQYLDTGKKYGDYFYYDYENKKDNKIYKKGNNYYLYDDRTKSYTDINQATNRLSDKKIEKEQLEKAKKLGYKEQERKTTKEYDKANSVFKKLQKQYKLSDKELQNFIDKGTLSQKHVSLVTNSMSNLARQAVEYREDIKKGKIKQYDDTVLSISDRLDLDTKGLTKKQRKEFEQDLLRQQKAKDNQYRGVRYGYDGTLKGTLQALTSTKERAADKISREIVAPINNIKENYEYGKKNNQLALEYYKKMEGKKNKADKLNKETELYNYFNKDLATNPGWAGTAIQNANTQVESLKKQGIAATVLGAAGAVVGTVVNPGVGTVAGAKAGASIGYTVGSTPYTYKLEVGNQYKELLSMGVPDKIAKEHSKRVGVINAAIESGENVVDLLTFNLAGKNKAIPTESIKELVDDYGDKQVKSWLSKSLGDKVADSMITAAKSYGQNIVSESIEEMSQEGTSIAGERLAAKESGIKRDKTLSEDINRVLDAGVSAAISTAFTAPISSVGGSIANTTMNNLQSKIQNKVISSQTVNDTINQEIINSNQSLTANEISDIQKATYQHLKDDGITINDSRQINENVSNANIQILNQYKSKSFDNDFEKFESGKYTTNDNIVLLDKTPDYFYNLGYESNNPVIVNMEKLKAIMKENKETVNGENHHGITKDIIEQLPYAISNPLNVIKNPKYKNRFVIVTELSDKYGDIIIVPIEMNAKGQIEGINTNVNKVNSIYGKETYDGNNKNNVLGYMEQNRNNIVYDIDNDIQKRASHSRLQLPKGENSSSKLIAPTDKIENQSVNRFVEQSVTDTNTTTNSQKSQIAPVSQNSMQQNKNNDTNNKQEINSNKQKDIKLPKIDKTQKTNKKEISKKIANTINETIKNDVIVEKQNEVKQRKWIDTALNSEVVDGKIVLEDLEPNKTNYMVQSNKKTLKKANNKLDVMGYDESVKYIQSKMNDSNVSLTDIVMAERLIQESIKKGDMQLANELIMDTAILGTEMGQKIQALSMIQRLTPEGQLKMLQKIVKRSKVMGDQSFQNVEITPEMVEKILDAYDKEGKFNQDDLNRRVEEVKQDIADQLKTTIGEKVDAWRYLAMLGNPTTHIRNMVSNVAMKGTIKAKNAIARTIETVAPIKNRTKTWKRATKEIKDYAKTTANEMKDVITGESKYGEKASIEKKKRIFKSKTLETVSNFNSNALEFEDWLFSKSAFTKTFQEYLTAQGIKTKEDIQNNPEIVEKGKLYSVRQAEIATFRQYSKMASTINRLERNSKIAKYPIKATVPFKKTPINVAKAGVNYSPLGLIKNITYDTTQLVKGNIEASQYVDNISQGLTGTSLALLGYALAKAGILNGSGEDDKESKFNSYLGKTGYSIKIGDKYYSLSWLSPVAMPLFVGSNMYEQLEEDKGWDANVVTEALAKTLDPLNEMSFLSGLTDALNSYDKGTDKIKGIGESVMQSYASQFFPTLLSKISSVADDTKRSTQVSSNSSYKFGEQTMRSIMYKIPGLHSKLEPVTNIWGNDVKQDDNVLVRAFENFIAPYSKKEDITTKMDKELKRVYQKVGKSEVIPGFPQSYVTYDKEKYKMSAKEYTQFKKTYGQSANTMLNLLIKDEDYKESADTRKSRMIDKVYNYSRDIAKQEFLKKRKIKINGKDFKYNKTDYEDIIDDILIHTRYLDGE